METLFSIIAALQPEEWITKIDLKDAYHHILVHVNIHKYFRFVVAGTVYQFLVLLFGLSTAPREFTKTLAPVIQLLRSQGIQVHAYLDDWIIRATSQEQSLKHTQHIIQLIQSLGWTINWDKSMLQTSRILDFLGLHFNLEQALLSPPASFLPTLTEVLSRLSPSTLMSASKVSIISRMSHFAPFISSGHLHLWFLQFWFKQQWTQHQQSWDTPVGCGLPLLPALVSKSNSNDRGSVTSSGPQSVLLQGCISQRLGSQLERPSDFRTMVNSRLPTSYQLVGTGGCPTCSTSMGFSVETSDCQSLLRQQYCSSIHPQTRGTHSQSLFRKTLELFELLDQFVITLIPTPLPGARNVTADALSHLSQPSPTEWRLPTEALNRLFCAFGTPLMDMFATAANKVTPVFVSPYQDDRAWAVDALSQSWDDLGLVYAFPPAPIVPKTLLKIQKSWGTTVIIIASQHPSRPWHPLLLQLSTRPRIPLLDIQLFQYVPNIRRPQYHCDPRLLDLAAWNFL